jgi:hypothetical protein
VIKPWVHGQLAEAWELFGTGVIPTVQQHR